MPRLKMDDKLKAELMLAVLDDSQAQRMSVKMASIVTSTGLSESDHRVIFMAWQETAAYLLSLTTDDEDGADNPQNPYPL